MNQNALPLLVTIDAAASNLLEGLVQEYASALGTGTVDRWATAAYSIIDLLASQEALAAPSNRQ